MKGAQTAAVVVTVGAHMTNAPDTHQLLPVRAGEFLCGVVAALGVEQVAQGTLVAIYGNKMLLGLANNMAVVLGAIALVMWIVNVYHGNAIYLASRYSRWHHAEVIRGAFFATPIRHLIDVMYQLLLYSLLVAAAALIERDVTFILTTWVIIGACLLDAIWCGASLHEARRSNESNAINASSLRSWIVFNLSTGFALAALLLAASHVPGFLPWMPLFFTVVLAVSVVLDYFRNYDFYFSGGNASRYIEESQAVFALGFLVAARQTVVPTQGDIKDRLKASLDGIFGYALGNDEARSLVFNRNGSANLHVGIYIRRSEYLVPIYRLHDSAIKINGRKTLVGEGYVGHSYLRLRESEDSAVEFTCRQDEHVYQPKEHRDAFKDADAKNYNSSVMAGLFWPPGGETRTAIGVINFTSSDESYFSGNLHKMMTVGLARSVEDILLSLFPGADEKQLRHALGDLVEGNPVRSIVTCTDQLGASIPEPTISNAASTPVVAGAANTNVPGGANA